MASPAAPGSIEVAEHRAGAEVDHPDEEADHGEQADARDRGRQRHPACGAPPGCRGLLPGHAACSEARISSTDAGRVDSPALAMYQRVGSR